MHISGGPLSTSSREKRNAKKRSFEQTLSATAAKILRMEQERGTQEKVRGQASGDVRGDGGCAVGGEKEV